jgi:hypothetical protein
MQVAEIMKRRLALASTPLATYGFSVRLPMRSDPLIANLWNQVVGHSTERPPSELLGGESPDVILTLLTRRSLSTLIESTAFAVVGSVPQVCVGIDMPVPSLLDVVQRVSSVEPSADESLFLRVVNAACQQRPQGQAGGVPVPAV